MMKTVGLVGVIGVLLLLGNIGTNELKEQAAVKPVVTTKALTWVVIQEGGAGIWKDDAARREAGRLSAIGSGGDLTLTLPLLACGVAKGTHVMMTDVGLMASTVLVIDGHNKGCRGVIGNDLLERG